MQLSVIIPVYNKEQYLARCLDSVIAATEKQEIKAEIIVVDNNSTDHSLEIIQQYAKKYPKLIFNHPCKTPSAGAARNYGTTKAKGEYIWFVDSDDEITEGSATLLLAKAKENHAKNSTPNRDGSACFSAQNAKNHADLVMMGQKRLNPDGSSSYLSAVLPTDKNCQSRFVRYGMGPCQLLIRREWWNKHGFKFKEGIIHEDMEIMSSLILYTDNFTGLDEPLYLYYQNPESILHRSKFDPKVYDIFPALEGLFARFEKAHAVEEYYAELEWFFIWNLLIDSAKDFAQFKEAHPGFAESRKMLKKYFPHWRRNKFLKQKPLKLRLRVRLNYYKG